MIKTTHRRWKLLLSLAIGLILAWGLAVWYLALRADQDMRADLLQQTRLVAQMIDVEEVRALTGTLADQDKPVYHRLKARLARAVLVHEHCRFIYLMGRRDDGSVFFFVDDVAVGHPDEVLPGDDYDEVPDSFRAVFDHGRGVTEGPFSDRWGSYVSGAVPIPDPESGAVLAVLAKDIDAAHWRGEVIAHIAVPAGLMLLLMVVALTALFATARVGSSSKSAPRQVMLPVFLLVASVLCALAVMAVTHYRWVIEREEHLRAEISTIARHLDRHAFERLTKAVEAVSRSPLLGSALSRESSGELDNPEAMRVLETLRLAMVGQIAYLMDTSGQVVACTPYAGGKTLTGNNYAFRPYFTRAIDGGTSLYPALGVTTNERGLYTSAPVKDEATGQVIGVLVAKSRMTEIDKWLSDAKLCVGSLISPDGVVMATTRPDWSYQLLQPISEERRAALRASRQFGDKPLEQLLTDDCGFGAAPADIQTRPSHRFHSVPVAMTDENNRPWRVVGCDQMPYPVEQIALHGGVALILGWLFSTLFLMRMSGRNALAAKQRELQQSEDRLSATLHSIGDGVIACNREGRVVSLNRAAESLTGWGSDEAAGQAIQAVFPIIHAQTRETVESPVLRALAEGVNVDLANDTALIARDGTEHHIADSCSPIREASGVVIGVALIFRDVTEEYHLRQREGFRLAFQQTVARISSRFVTMNEEALDTTIETDLADLGTIFDADRCYVFRYSADGRHMSNTHEWCATEIRPCKDELQNLPVESLPWWNAQMTGAEVVHLPLVAELPEEAQAERELMLSQQIQSLICVPMLDDQGKAIGFLGMDLVRRAYRWEDEQVAMLQVVAEIIAGAIINTEHRRRSMEELRAYAEQIEAVNDLLSQQQDRLLQMQKMEAIGQLAAGVAHEINTPIQFVGDNVRFLKDAFGDLLGANERLLEMLATDDAASGIGTAVKALNEEIDLDFLREEIPQAISQTVEGVERVASIVQAMKEFAHHGGGELVAADLNRAIDSTLVISRNEYKYTADIETQLDPELPPVICDIDAIKQVILNLVVNAAQAIQDHLAAGAQEGQRGVIRVSTMCEQDVVILRVQDDGGGIPEEIRPRLYEPFFTTKEVGRGSGQGLPLVHKVVVAQHRGKIDIESTVGIGTAFIIRLPLEPPDEDASSDEFLARRSGIRPALGGEHE